MLPKTHAPNPHPKPNKVLYKDIHLKYILCVLVLISLFQNLTKTSNNHKDPKHQHRTMGNIHHGNITYHLITTSLIKINCGTIQDDTLSPYLFIFLEPLLRWLEKVQLGYHFSTSSSTITTTTTTYANDPTILTDNIEYIQPNSN